MPVRPRPRGEQAQPQLLAKGVAPTHNPTETAPPLPMNWLNPSPVAIPEYLSGRKIQFVPFPQPVVLAPPARAAAQRELGLGNDGGTHPKPTQGGGRGAQVGLRGQGEEGSMDGSGQ